jgi:hypothetical protein
MEKTARKPSTDPAQERLRQNKANWNKEVSAFVNDLIHFKKMMNGWPSKFFKERSRITQPVPADPATIIGSLAGDFQEIVNKGNGVIQEQLDYSKNRRQRQPKQMNLPLPEPGKTPAPEESKPVAPDLSKQLQLGLGSSGRQSELIKLAFVFEDKYSLEAQASNPFSRFITKLFNPKFGFGEGARIRRLRISMLDNCVAANKELKKLHKEIVKSSKESIMASHNMMNQVWGHWNAVNRLFSAYKSIRPGDVVTDTGGPIGSSSLPKRDKGSEKTQAPAGEEFAQAKSGLVMIRDFKENSPLIGTQTKSLAFRELNSLIESILAMPEHVKLPALQHSYTELLGYYQKALLEVNMEKQTSGQSFAQIVSQLKAKPVETKTAQKWLGKVRHQVLPGASSSQRLEVYRLIEQLRKSLDQVMNLLEEGFDQERLTSAITQVNQEVSTLRTMLRSLYFLEKPPSGQKGKQDPSFFDRMTKIEDLM